MGWTRTDVNLNSKSLIVIDKEIIYLRREQFFKNLFFGIEILMMMFFF